MICQKCGAVNNSALEKCRVCGNDLSAGKAKINNSNAPSQPKQICSKCGVVNTGDTKICTLCGNNLNICAIKNKKVTDNNVNYSNRNYSGQVQNTGKNNQKSNTMNMSSKNNNNKKYRYSALSIGGIALAVIIICILVKTFSSNDDNYTQNQNKKQTDELVSKNNSSKETSNTNTSSEDKTSSNKIYIGPYSEGLAPFMKDGNWGFMDENKNVVIKPTYIFAKFFSEGYAPVCTQSGWGTIDKKGNFSVKPIYRNIWGSFSGAVAAQGENGTFRYLNPDGTEFTLNKNAQTQSTGDSYIDSMWDLTDSLMNSMGPSDFITKLARSYKNLGLENSMDLKDFYSCSDKTSNQIIDNSNAVGAYYDVKNKQADRELEQQKSQAELSKSKEAFEDKMEQERKEYETQQGNYSKSMGDSYFRDGMYDKAGSWYNDASNHYQDAN